MVSVVPPEGTSRNPVDICCVVDVSGSMGTEAMVQTESGGQTGHGLSVLDIVKHSMKTIIRTLQDNDRLALVSYSTEAKVVFGVTRMDAAGRATSEAKLDELVPEGMTNLWDGMKNGIELLKAAQQPGRLQHIMLFTDGLPNINPPRGILPMTKRLKDKEPGGRLPCTINTFGFGYELDSELLSDLAIIGSGTYAFIPDAGFVGSVFVNGVSNLLVTMAKDVELTLKPINGASINSVMGGYPSVKNGEGFIVNLGCMQFGQARNVVVEMAKPSGVSDCLEASVQYVTRAGSDPIISQAKGGALGVPPFDAKVIVAQHLRLRMVETVRECMKKVKLTKADVASNKQMPLNDAADLLLDLTRNKLKPALDNDKDNEFLQLMLEDLEGQISEAFSRQDWYTKWGVHYLPSLTCAHLAQVCNNFKDPSVQQYGGEVFNNVVGEAEDIFTTLPAPQASARSTPAQESVTERIERPVPVARTPAPVVDMSMYFDRYGG
jgi:hypothetical protein